MYPSTRPEAGVRRPVLVPVVPARGYLPPGIDRFLTHLALHYDLGDADVRNALFAAFEPRLRHLTDNLWRRQLRDWPCERDDLEQEVFVVFCELLARWHGAGSFAAYVHGAFPWRLREAARRNAPTRPPAQLTALPPLAQDDSWMAAEAIELLEKVAGTLDPFERRLLLLKVRNGFSLRTVARELGVDERTIRRAWRALIRRLRREALDTS
jgi:RNA polymerase sigma factor (sigma-70 family)